MKFNKEISPKPLRISKTKTKPVQTVFVRDLFQVFLKEEMNFKIIELPYIKKRELGMFILLPDDISDNTTGLELLERELTYEKLGEWTSLDKMMTEQVDVYLPKIKLDKNYDLGDILRNMRLSDAFSQSEADFRRMSERKNLFLSKVIHQSVAEINEEGTVASRVPVVIPGFVAPSTLIQVMADHPFPFFIRHKKTKSILFFRKFCSP